MITLKQPIQKLGQSNMNQKKTGDCLDGKLKFSSLSLFFIQGTVLGALILTLASCSPAESNMARKETSLAQNKSQINSYFDSIFSWSEISPEKNESRDPVGNVKISQSENRDEKGQINVEECTVQDFDLTKTPEKIVMQNPAAGILYPGSLIQGKGYLLGAGSLRELPIRERAPISIATDLNFEGNSAVIRNINYASYQAALAQILAQAKRQNVKPGANLVYDQVEVQNSEQAALDLGFSVKYLGKNASGEVDAKSSSKENSFMVAFEHRAFTVSAVAPETAAGFFSGDLSIDKMKTYERRGVIGEENPPLYVSSVNYGRLLLFTVTSTASREDLKTAIEGSFDNVAWKVDADIKAKYQKIMSESKIKIISMGGEQGDVESLIKSGRVKDYFTGINNLDNYTPISYVLKSVKDNSVAKVSETTRYSVQSCNPVTPKAWRVKVTLNTMKFNYVGAYRQRKGEIYGLVALNDLAVWSHDKKDYRQFRRGDIFEFGHDRNNIEVVLPTSGKPTPVRLQVNLYDSDNKIWLPDDQIASVVTYLGYTPDGRVVPDGTYEVSDLRNSNVEITYTVQRVKAELE